jgi:nucleoside-specific outer membrane channel protein Tsx
MKKRLLACALAATMILGSTAPVLAADDGSTQGTNTLWMEEQTLVSGHSRNCM